MITRAILEMAYNNGIVRLIDNPDGGKAIVGIGDEWNYLYCKDTYNCTAAEVLERFSKEYILDGIFEMLETLRDPEDDDDTYDKYERIIMEALFPAEKRHNKMRFVADKITEILAKEGNIKCSYCVVYNDLSGIDSREIPCDTDGCKLSFGRSYMVLLSEEGGRLYINVSYDSIHTACAKVFESIIG